MLSTSSEVSPLAHADRQLRSTLPSPCGSRLARSGSLLGCTSGRWRRLACSPIATSDTTDGATATFVSCLPLHFTHSFVHFGCAVILLMLRSKLRLLQWDKYSSTWHPHRLHSPIRPALGACIDTLALAPTGRPTTAFPILVAASCAHKIHAQLHPLAHGAVELRDRRVRLHFIRKLCYICTPVPALAGDIFPERNHSVAVAKCRDDRDEVHWSGT
jgi:hypothetical protein